MLTEMNAKLDTILQKANKDDTPIMNAISDLKKQIVGEPAEPKK
jgi:hypothetical protein